MKIKKFNEEQNYSFYYYEIYDEYNDNIIGNYDFEENFDSQDLKDTIRYLMEVEKYNSNSKNRFHVRKIKNTYEQINEEEIEKIKKEIELEDKSYKYNI